VDLDSLFRHFGATVTGFWDVLVRRSRALSLTRPLFYGLRYAAAAMKTPVPTQVLESASVGQPNGPVLALMDALVARALVPAANRAPTAAENAARAALYVRSHWLRMPPGLLVSHLSRKAVRRWAKADEGQ
jgi:hypothetical protein